MVFIHVLLSRPIVLTEFIHDLAAQEAILIILIVTVLVVVEIIRTNSQQALLPLQEALVVAVAIVPVVAVLDMEVELVDTAAVAHAEDKM